MGKNIRDRAQKLGRSLRSYYDAPIRAPCERRAAKLASARDLERFGVAVAVACAGACRVIRFAFRFFRQVGGHPRGARLPATVTGCPTWVEVASNEM